MNQNNNLNKIIEKSHTSPSSPKKFQNKLKINKKYLNEIDDDILNQQKFYDLIGKFRNKQIYIGNQITKPKMNFKNKSYIKQKNSLSYNNLQKDIENLCKYIYKDKNSTYNNICISSKFDKKHEKKKVNKDNKKYIEEYKIKSLKYDIPINYSKNKRNEVLNYLSTNYQKKKILKNEKDNKTNARYQISENKKMKNNITDYLPEQKNKKIHIMFDNGNYGYSSINFKHPQLYVLNNNNNHYKNKIKKLPLIENPFGIEIRRADLSNLVPKNREISIEKDNFYNYNIGKKLIKKKFNY